MARTFHCFECHNEHPMIVKGQAAYGQSVGGALICPDCLGRIIANEMKETGKATLYLVRRGGSYWEVQDFYGVLRFPCTYFVTGKHNIAHTQIRFRFTGPDGREWSGFNVGDNMVAHCKRNVKFATRDKLPLAPHVYFHHFDEEREEWQT